MNAHLPEDVRVWSAVEKPQAFHATLDARSKRYRYVIDNGASPTRFSSDIAGTCGGRSTPRRWPAHRRALLGRHDFHSFETDWPNRTSSVRTIFDVAVEHAGSRVTIEVEADGFLYNMVRAIAGTLGRVGTGKRPESWVAEVLAAENRAEAGPTAPAKGLFLIKVLLW